MKGPQTLVSSTDDAPHSVFAEPMGTDITPTVQVSLAKRIVQSDTNRVICLAAKTTVPIREGDLASVSDLALRLSDGTNVVLSMSFFNDAPCQSSFVNAQKQSSSTTSARYVYDPDRYNSHRSQDASPRLWFVLGGIAITLLAIFLVAPPASLHKFSPKLALPPLPSAPQSHAPTLRTPSAKQSPLWTMPYFNRKAGAKSVASSYRTRPSAKQSSPQPDSNPRSFFVPPPPPTAYPLPLSQFSEFDISPYIVSPLQKTKTVVDRRPEGGKPTVPGVARVNSDRVTEPPQSFDKPVERLPEKIKQVDFPTLQPQHSHTVTNDAGSQAPLPGNTANSDSPAFERIVLPE